MKLLNVVFRIQYNDTWTILWIFLNNIPIFYATFLRGKKCDARRKNRQRGVKFNQRGKVLTDEALTIFDDDAEKYAYINVLYVDVDATFRNMCIYVRIKTYGRCVFVVSCPHPSHGTENTWTGRWDRLPCSPTSLTLCNKRNWIKLVYCILNKARVKK